MKKFYDIKQYLEGKKTYIGAAIMALLNLAAAFGLVPITTEQLYQIDAALAALLGVTISAKINRAL